MLEVHSPLPSKSLLHCYSKAANRRLREQLGLAIGETKLTSVLEGEASNLRQLVRRKLQGGTRRLCLPLSVAGCLLDQSSDSRADRISALFLHGLSHLFDEKPYDR